MSCRRSTGMTVRTSAASWFKCDLDQLIPFDSVILNSAVCVRLGAKNKGLRRDFGSNCSPFNRVFFPPESCFLLLLAKSHGAPGSCRDAISDFSVTRKIRRGKTRSRSQNCESWWISWRSALTIRRWPGLFAKHFRVETDGWPIWSFPTLDTVQFKKNKNKQTLSIDPLHPFQSPTDRNEDFSG